MWVAFRFQVLVEGHDMLRVMGTTGVLGTKTKSNDIMETWKYLGIEAARSIIMAEIHKTMSSHGMSIDARHTMLLADCMTSKVSLLSHPAFLDFFLHSKGCVVPLIDLLHINPQPLGMGLRLSPFGNGTACQLCCNAT